MMINLGPEDLERKLGGIQPAKEKKPTAAPVIEQWLLLKWGLALLGDEKASEYIEWLRARLHGRHT